ncbi:Retrograde regulation protein 2 [Fusarium oxysporum f. sp. albedinis]|nr:Retrograde regulation protein 2 [Fusarium oxysporum f. sp. albedinis]
MRKGIDVLRISNPSRSFRTFDHQTIVVLLKLRVIYRLLPTTLGRELTKVTYLGTRYSKVPWVGKNGRYYHAQQYLGCLGQSEIG